jgi:hypothetical protein
MPKEPKEDVYRLSFRIPMDLYNQVERLAEEETRPINSQLIAMLKQSIRSRENLDDMQKALKFITEDIERIVRQTEERDKVRANIFNDIIEQIKQVDPRTFNDIMTKIQDVVDNTEGPY